MLQKWSKLPNGSKEEEEEETATWQHADHSNYTFSFLFDGDN
jgi:hypothetical protein